MFPILPFFLLAPVFILYSLSSSVWISNCGVSTVSQMTCAKSQEPKAT